MHAGRLCRLAFRVGTGVAILAVVAAAQAAQADGGPSGEGSLPPTPAAERGVRVTPTVEYGFPADLPGERGVMSLLRAQLGVAGTVPVNRCLLLQLTFAAEVDAYDLSDPDAIVPGSGRLLDEGRYARFEPLAKLDLPRGWGLIAGPVVQSAGVPGARFEETLTWGGQASVKFPISASTSLVLGASVETKLEGSWSIFPLLDIQGISTGSIVLGVRGTGIRAGIPLSPCLALGLSARYDRRDWRLAESDRVPEGVFRDIRIAFGVDLEWRARPSLAVSIGTWLNAYHEIRIDDRHGDPVTSFNADPSFTLATSVSISF